MSTEPTTPGFAHELTDEELESVHGGMMKHEKGPTMPCGHDFDERAHWVYCMGY